MRDSQVGNERPSARHARRRRRFAAVFAWLVVLAVAHGAAAGFARAGDAPPTPAAPPVQTQAGAPTPPPDTSNVEAALEEPEPAPNSIVPEVVKVAPPPPGLLRPAFGLCYPNPCVSPFFTDTDIRLHLRTFYFDRHNPNQSINEAWAGGGWLQYTSGWLNDVFQIGATGYTSQPLYAPDSRDGTSLLAPGQDAITVLGQAYARLRYCDRAILTAYRQSVNDGYVGPQDNRMIPNTFEGVTLRGTLGSIDYDIGYLWDMKPRNSEKFISMSQQAGVAGSDDGLEFGSLKWTPNSCWEVFAGDYYTPDVFNTAYAYAKHTRRLGGYAEGNFGVQYTDQRSVGNESLGSFNTWNAGIGARVIWDSGLTLGAAFHTTADEAGIRSPYGSWPGYLSLIETDFDRAGEQAFGVGLKYDFGKRLCAPGLLGVLAYARGVNRRDPATGSHLSDTDEFDLDVTYDIPSVKGLQVRFRNAYVKAGGPDTGYQFRLILNWEIDLL
jgi:hypothetical protein